MRTVALLLYIADKELFALLRQGTGNAFLDDYAGLLGNMWAWVPFLVFLGTWLYLSRPAAASLGLMFGILTFTLAYLSATLLANVSMQPAPWWLEYRLHGLELPAIDLGDELSLPDWGVATLAGTFHYVRLKLRSWEVGRTGYCWLAIAVAAFLRMYAGYTYPLGVLVGLMVGIFLGWLMFQMDRNVAYLMAARGGGETGDNGPQDGR